MKKGIDLICAALLVFMAIGAVPAPPRSVPTSVYKIWSPDACVNDGRIILVGLPAPGSDDVAVGLVDAATLSLITRRTITGQVGASPTLLCEDPVRPYLMTGRGIYKIEKGLTIIPTLARFPPTPTGLSPNVVAAAFGETIAIAWTVAERTRTSHIRVYEKKKLVLDVDFGDVISAMALVPERSLLYFRDDSHLGVLNYHTGHAHYLLENNGLYGRSGRCGRLIVFGTPDHRRQDDLLIVDPDTGAQKLLGARGFELHYAACSSTGEIYAVGWKGWTNVLTEGYHLTDVRLFRYDPASGKLTKSSRSILHDAARQGLFAVDGQRAYEFAGSYGHYPEMVKHTLCEEPLSALEALFSQ